MSAPRPRLSVRRASTTAPDPFATRARPDHDLHASSTLTIVRLVPAPPPADPPAPAIASPRRLHRRLPSQPSTSPPAPAPPDPARLSFAFSSFAHSTAPGGPARAPSPSRRQHPGPTPHPRLSADQLLDLARSATSPTYAPHTPSRSRPASPSLTRPQSPGPPAAATTTTPTTTTAATFTPLPDNIHLPFIDRPAEVAALIASPPSAKLFSLLAQTFPPDDAPDLADPVRWSYPQLHAHLTHAPRSAIPDDLWVLQARKAILAHSELIWERVKGALGVPPDLDIDYDHTVPFYFHGASLDHLSSALSDGSTDTDDIPDDHGRSAHGHWDDWDATLDSPVYDRRQSIPPSPDIPLSFAPARHTRPGSDPTGLTLSTSPISNDPHPPSPNPPAEAEPLLSIEPLLFGTTPTPSSHPPASMPTCDATSLDDIQEGAEDEDDAPPSASTEHQHPNDPPDLDLIAPSQIQGLRISTAPLHPPAPALPPSLSSSSTTTLPPVSPLPPYPSIPQPRSRPPSAFGSVRRSGSIGSIASLSDWDQTSEGGYTGPLFPSSFAGLGAGARSSLEIRRHKPRTLSQGEGAAGSVLGGTVVGYKRLSWGTAPAVVG